MLSIQTSLTNSYINNHFISNIMKICMRLVWKFAIGHFVVFQSKLFFILWEFGYTSTKLPGIQCFSRLLQCSKEMSRPARRQISVTQGNALCAAEYPWTSRRVLKKKDSAFTNPAAVLSQSIWFMPMRISVIMGWDIHWTVLFPHHLTEVPSIVQKESSELKIYLQINGVLQ